MVINPVTIQLAGAVVTTLIQQGRLAVTEVRQFLADVLGQVPDLTAEQMDAIVSEVLDRAEVREALSRAEAGEV